MSIYPLPPNHIAIFFQPSNPSNPQPSFQCPRRGHPWPPKSSPPMKQFLTLLRMLPSMVMLSLILLFEWLTGHEL